ncbi:MAG: excinuclease ABC subunit C [Ferruginibacter sp.]|nr:excinuclease ABC subunit C [Cytophagales bacterium]
MPTSSHIQPQLATLPDQPGVYRYYDQEGELLYVGKAKSLKNRVSSYFTKLNPSDSKTRRLVAQIHRIEYTIVNTELDALLLENSLIKQHQPKYNILLKDDKTYPYICIPYEPIPRVITTRLLDRAQGTFYGPYASVRAMNAVLEVIRQLYSIRTCNLQLTDRNVEERKFKVCLEYHLGNCKGPCEGLVSREAYEKDVEQIHHILKGNLGIPQHYFRTRMQEAAQQLSFELAQQYKQKLELLEKFQSKSLIVNPKITDADVFTIVSDEGAAYVNYLRIVNGTINQTKTVEVKKKLDEADADLLAMVIVDLRNELNSTAKEIITNVPLEADLQAVNHVPQIGDKKKLVDLSLKNVLFYKKEKAEKASLLAGEPREERVLRQLQQDLRLPSLPRHIECFDNSNIQGTNPVAAMVSFKNGKPAKKDYRHFHIKTVIGPNDFASMHEVVTRRYARLLEEGGNLPDLIIIDGGKGQLHAACDALKELNLYGQIPIVGIAKRLEELYFPEDAFPLYIDKKSESLKLIQRARDEAHRFGITFHRDLRSKNSLGSQLNAIDGVGDATVTKLLGHFKTISNVKKADWEELVKVVGKDKAEKVKQALG